MLSKQSINQQKYMIQEHIDYQYANNFQTNELAIESEYSVLVGKSYNQRRQEYGNVSVNQKQLNQTDIKVAQSLYINGRSKQEIINTVMKKSPAVQTMTKTGRELYKRKLLRQMNAVEPKREKIQKQKQVYGIDSNCKRNVQNYLKCIKAEQQARKQGMMVGHLNYRQFQKEKSPDFYKGYVAKIEKDTRQQQQLDRERQQKREQQNQQQRQRQRGL